MSISLYGFLRQIVNLSLMVVDFFIGLRIVFKLFSANPATPFVAWINSVSEALISPFRGIAPDLFIGIGVVDLTAIITFAIYSILGYFVLSLIASAISPVEPEAAHYHRHH